MNIQNLGMALGVVITPQKDKDIVNNKEAKLAALSATWLKEMTSRPTEPT